MVLFMDLMLPCVVFKQLNFRTYLFTYVKNTPLLCERESLFHIECPTYKSTVNRGSQKVKLDSRPYITSHLSMCVSRAHTIKLYSFTGLIQKSN